MINPSTLTLKLELKYKLEDMSKVNLWVHIVWLTKLRKPFIRISFKWKLYKHIRANADEKNIHVDFINGTEDHIHCLIKLKPTQSLSNVVQQLKGESSKWINDNKLLDEYFEWQHQYYASSVSESQIEKVRAYINNQEKHHKEISTDFEVKNVFK